MLPEKDSIHLLNLGDIRNIPVPPARVVDGHGGKDDEEEKLTGKFSPADEDKVNAKADNGVTDNETLDHVDR